jgi:ACS family hexuronate transporter-like MFS transporter
MTSRDTNLPARPDSWKWVVCGMLLLASAINYMDRQTLANASVRITKEFHIDQAQYGQIEAVFAYSFAAGSLVFGWLSDRVSVRWLYAFILAAWSAVGFATSFAHDHGDLLHCRMLLGFFEAGHWPCGIRTTRALLSERDRSLGNGVLQSGTSVGAIVTPLVMNALMTPETGSWRLPFQVVGAAGVLWLVLWFGLLRDADLRPPASAVPAVGAGTETPSLWRIVFSRRMLVVFAMIACINTTWQILRAWLPKILQEGRGYPESQALYFNSAWFAATDVGCLGAGLLAVWLVKRGWTVHGSRVLVFALCGAACALCALVPMLGRGWMLLALLLLAGAGALGVFPIYHAFTQDLSAEHQGKITGIAGVAGWVVPAQAQKLFGALADRLGSFDRGIVLASGLPLLAALILWLFWNPRPKPIPR